MFCRGKKYTPSTDMIFRLFITPLFLLHFIGTTFAYDITASPSFWLSRIDSPDTVLMDTAEIKKFNGSIVASINQMANIEEMPDTISGDKVREYLLHDPLPYDRKRFDKEGKRLPQRFFKQIEENIDIPPIKTFGGMDRVGAQVEVRFGVIVKEADIRAFPTDKSIHEYPKALDFDTAQYSKIYPPQPAALLHVSKDKKWGFFQTGFVRGWIKMDKVVFADDKTKVFHNTSEFLVITGSFVSVYKDKKLNKVLEKLPMGTRLKITGEDDNKWIIDFPYRAQNGLLRWDNAYIKKRDDVHIGFLAYTKGNIIRQAFKMLGERYGWGNINGRRDCSSFIKDVFATVGLNMPRNSGQQILAGRLLGHVDNGSSASDLKESLKSAIPGITLLGLNRHIMLYLGRVDKNDYAIHSLFGYGDVNGFKAVNSTVVTDLNLGKDTKAGAFINRLKGITILNNEPR